MSRLFVTIPGADVLEELGRGAHSAVYRVRRGGRYYAAKVPLATADPAESELARRRFFREAVALARVRHPVLPRVLEVGRVGELPYLILELAAGETLAERLRQGPLDEMQARELATQLCDALVRVHESGLVHRDITPSNILFDSLTTAVRLVDFGFVTRADTGQPETDDPLGQLRRSGDTRGDLLALGYVLFECITGKPPLGLVDASLFLEQPAHGEAPARAGLSAGFALVLRRLLGAGAEAAYIDAGEALDDLRELDAARTPTLPSTRALRARLGIASSVPMLGRGRELERLRAARRASLGAYSQIVLLRGPRGSGKSRLLGAFAEEITAERQACFAVTCKRAERVPFGVVRQIVESLLDDYDALPPAKRLAAIAKLRAIAGEVAPLLRLLSPRLARVFQDSTPLPRNEGAEHIFSEGLTRFLAQLFADLGPAVVMLDDVQWLDSGSRRVVSRLTDDVTSDVLYVFSAREDADSAESVDRLVRTLDQKRLGELRLRPIDENTVVDLVRAYLAYDRPDPELVRCVVSFSDGTPLSAIEILRSMLEAGVLLPHWGDWKFDAEEATRMGLPRGSLELVSRRIAELERSSLRVLSAAAVIGSVFEAELLGRVTREPAHRVSALILDWRRGMLIETVRDGVHRFTHDSVREALLQRATEQEIAGLHEDVAAVLVEDLTKLEGEAAAADEWLSPAFFAEATGATRARAGAESNEEAETAKIDLCFELAGHYLEGERFRSPERAYAACAAAGRLAFRSYDNERALRFFDAAALAARLLGRELPVALELTMAEARLRSGALEAAIPELRAVVERSEDSTVRGYALSRIAWAEMQSDTDRAWASLDEALRVLGARPIVPALRGVLLGVFAWFARFFPSRAPVRGPERRRLAVVCDLYYQAARLAADTGKPAVLAQVVLRGLAPAERLGPSAALNKSYLIYSFLLTMLGARGAGRRYLRRAEEIAANIRNPILYAFTLQVHAVIAAWAGDVNDSLQAGARSLEQYGHWRELSDYAVTAYNQQQIESVRGRALAGWKWLEMAIAKLSKHEEARIALDFLDVSVRAALTSLGREHEATQQLARLRHLMSPQKARLGVGMTPYGAKVRLFTERGDLGAEFEQLVREVRDQKLNPKRAHLSLSEYYVHVAHARVHACLRADPGSLPEKVALLAGALKELEQAAVLPVLRAHAEVIRAYHRFFSGAAAEAEKLFDGAERLARQEGAPWVLYAAYRGRAHLARAHHDEEQARDHARLAETLAREHGAAYRLRWVREEFLLRSQPLAPREVTSPSPSPSASSVSESGMHPTRVRPRGYLRSLVRVGQCTANELALDNQVQVVLDELIEALRAERGYLFLSRARIREEEQPADNARDSVAPPPFEAATVDALVLVCAKQTAGQEAVQSSYDSKLVDDLWVFGGLDSGDEGGLPGLGTVAAHGERAIVATSLVVRGGRVGVVYLDRPGTQGHFSDADARLLAALASQVPLVFELARSLRARERAEETQRSTEKLEAIGRLAGGIAHDFNNMLSVILSASEQILAQPDEPGLEDDVLTIQSAAQRARDLTRQLLAFSRGQYLNPEVLELNDVVRRLTPIFRRLCSPGVTLETRLDPELCRVKADPAQIDQVLTNLVVNACDAMRSGGKLLIETRNVAVPEASGSEPPSLRPGRYARIVVSDTGEGMDEATRAKAFEPFFTTKPTGSGLGLATAYGIVTQSGGHIELESQLGSGATFRLFLPETVQRVSTMPPAAAPFSQRVPRGKETILVVDDEPLVRESTRRMLRSLGYTVITAKDSDEALRIAGESIDDIDLVISDVIMPGMNGLELARELSKLRATVRVLFVSGYTAGVLTERGVFRDAVDFLQKPISLDILAARIRSMLDVERSAAGAPGGRE